MPSATKLRTLCWVGCLLALVVAPGLCTAQASDSAQVYGAQAILWRDSLPPVVRLAPLRAGARLAVVPDSTVPLITIGLAWSTARPADVPLADLHRRLLARPIVAPYLPEEPDQRLRQIGGQFTTAQDLAVSSALLTVPRDKKLQGLQLLRDWFASERFDTFYVGSAKAALARERQAELQLPRAQLSQAVARALSFSSDTDYDRVRPITLAEVREQHRAVRAQAHLWMVGGEVDSAEVASITAYLADSVGLQPTTSLASAERWVLPLRDSVVLLVNDLTPGITLEAGFVLPRRSAQDLVRAELLAELINLRTARFQRSLVSRELARTVRAELEPQAQATLLRIRVEPAEVASVERCISALEAEIGSLIDLTYWKTRDVQAAQQRLEAGYEFTREPTSRFCRTLPRWWALGHLDLATTYPSVVRGVDGFALSEWASEVLVEQATTLGILAPSQLAERLGLAELAARRTHPERFFRLAAVTPPTPVVAPVVTTLPPEVVNLTSKAEGPMWADSLAPLTVRFALGKTRLDSTARVQIRALAALLQRHPKLRLFADGHTDKVGSAAFNQQLAEQRATLVRTYLVGRLGIAASRVRVRSFGERKPAVLPSNTVSIEEARALNRRVEFSVR